MKLKLKLENIEVKSFVTTLNKNESKTVIGKQQNLQVLYSRDDGGCLSQAESMCCDTDHRLCPGTQCSTCTHFPTGCTPNGSQCP